MNVDIKLHKLDLPDDLALVTKLQSIVNSWDLMLRGIDYV